MTDIKALQLLTKQKSLLAPVLEIPKNEDETERFMQRSESPIDNTLLVLDEISNYAKEISEEMDNILGWIQASTEAKSESILTLLKKLTPTSTGTSKTQGRQYFTKAKFTSARNRQDPSAVSKALEIARQLQETEFRKQKLKESILKTKAALDKVNATGDLTHADLDGLKKAIKEWRDIDIDKLKEEKRKKMKRREEMHWTSGGERKKK